MLTIYSIKDASKKYGFSESRLYDEIRAGRLLARMPRGASRGWCVTDEIMDDWFLSSMRVAGEECSGRHNAGKEHI